MRCLSNVTAGLITWEFAYQPSYQNTFWTVVYPQTHQWFIRGRPLQPTRIISSYAFRWSSCMTNRFRIHSACLRTATCLIHAQNGVSKCHENVGLTSYHLLSNRVTSTTFLIFHRLSYWFGLLLAIFDLCDANVML